MKQNFMLKFFVPLFLTDINKEPELSNWFERFAFVKLCHQSLGPLTGKEWRHLLLMFTWHWLDFQRHSREVVFCLVRINFKSVVFFIQINIQYPDYKPDLSFLLIFRSTKKKVPPEYKTCCTDVVSNYVLHIAPCQQIHVNNNE